MTPPKLGILDQLAEGYALSSFQLVSLLHADSSPLTWARARNAALFLGI